MWYIINSLDSLLLDWASCTFLYMRLWMMLMPQKMLKAIAISSSQGVNCIPFILLHNWAIPTTSLSSLMGMHRMFLIRGRKIRRGDKIGRINLPCNKSCGLIHSLVEKGMRVSIADVEQFSGHGNVASNALIFGNSNFWNGLLMTKLYYQRSHIWVWNQPHFLP